MKLVPLIRNVSLGASAGVALLTALPVFGAIGTITAAGAVVGSLAGGMTGVLDTWRDQPSLATAHDHLGRLSRRSAAFFREAVVTLHGKARR